MTTYREPLFSPLTKRHPSVVAILAALLLAACGGGDGGDDAQPSPAPPPPAPSPPAPEPTPAESANLNRTSSRWIVSAFTNSVDGKRTTVLRSDGGQASFVIHCSGGKVEFYAITTSFVTGSGRVRYRVGNTPPKVETWGESSGFDTLFPRPSNPLIFKQLYQNWDFVAELDRYAGGYTAVRFGSGGFPATVDKTREECGWSKSDFPEANGWTSPIPDMPPDDALEAVYQPASEFSMRGWIASRPDGSKQLMVRLMEDRDRCSPGLQSLINDQRLYVWQDSRRVSAVPGFTFGALCRSSLPFTLALQGDFDASRPLLLTAHGRHDTALDPGPAIAEIRFE